MAARRALRPHRDASACYALTMLRAFLFTVLILSTAAQSFAAMRLSEPTRSHACCPDQTPTLTHCCMDHCACSPVADVSIVRAFAWCGRAVYAPQRMASRFDTRGETPPTRPPIA